MRGQQAAESGCSTHAVGRQLRIQPMPCPGRSELVQGGEDRLRAAGCSGLCGAGSNLVLDGYQTIEKALEFFF